MYKGAKNLCKKVYIVKFTEEFKCGKERSNNVRGRGRVKMVV